MIKLTKIQVNPDSDADHSSTIEEYRKEQDKVVMGEPHEDKSPPVEYYIIGEMIGALEEGKSLIVDRRIRNGVKIMGTFMSSPIVSIEKVGGDKTYITTNNSVYLMEYVNAEDFEL